MKIYEFSQIPPETYHKLSLSVYITQIFLEQNCFTVSFDILFLSVYHGKF